MTAAMMFLLALLCDGVALVAARLAAAKSNALPYPRSTDELQRLIGTATDWANWAREQLREGARLAR